MGELSIIELFIVLFCLIFLAGLLYAVYRRFVRSACKKPDKEAGNSNSSPGEGQQRQESRVENRGQVVGNQLRQTIYLGNPSRAPSIYTIPFRRADQRGQNQNFVVIVRQLPGNNNNITSPPEPPPPYHTLAPPPYSPKFEEV